MMITLLYRPLRPPKIHLAGRSNFDSAHYSNLSISTHPPTMLLHHFGFQDLFFFPGHPRGWAGLPCWQGEGSIVQFLIQVVKSYRYGSIWATFGSKNDEPRNLFRSRTSSVSSVCSTPSSASSESSPSSSSSTEQFWNQYRRRPPTTSMTKMLKKALTSRMPSRCFFHIIFSFFDKRHNVMILSETKGTPHTRKNVFFWALP